MFLSWKQGCWHDDNAETTGAQSLADNKINSTATANHSSDTEFSDASKNQNVPRLYTIMPSTFHWQPLEHRKICI